MRWFTLGRVLLVAALVAQAACSDDAISTGAADVPTDVLSDIMPDLFVGTTDLGKPDIQEPEDATELGVPSDFGQECTQNSDCESGWCVDSYNQKVCSRECLTSCPSGWLCVEVTNTAPDTTYVCVPAMKDLCKPCTDSKQCGALPDVCIDIGVAKSCAIQCSETVLCPQGFECSKKGETSYCLPASGSCECTPELDGTTRPCSLENEAGVCFGLETCDGPNGWSGCDAREPEAEVCNGKDDDCDGTVDEEMPAEPCEKANLHGKCVGENACQGEKGWVCSATVPGEDACNGKDDDCDGVIDPMGAAGCTTYYRDEDADGYGIGFDSECLCGPAAPYLAELPDDCDDGAPTVNPGAPEQCNGVDDDCDGETDEPEGGDSAGCVSMYFDGDGDGYGLTDDSKCLCAPEDDYSAEKDGDCNDEDEDVHPDAQEVCNEADDDCDGEVDEEDAEGCVPYYKDEDEDGVGQAGDVRCLCAEDAPYTALLAGDCDDKDPSVGPGGQEICNGLDDDCDLEVDEADAEGCTPYQKDQDGDGFGSDSDAKCLCSPEGAYDALQGGDCNDTNSSIHPDASEVCNGADDDCDGTVDPDGTSGCKALMHDGDGDGYGVTGDEKCLCTPFGAYTASAGGDCNDADAAIAPSKPEKCNDIDDNCDGEVDEQGAQGCEIHYVDSDGDGFGFALDAKCLCAAQAPYSSLTGNDCDDSDPDIGPGGEEVCNGVDDDCDFQIDEAGSAGCTTYLKDQDGDGFGTETSTKCLCGPETPYDQTQGGDCNDTISFVYPGAEESCNGLDDDCDGLPDPQGAKGCKPFYLDQDADGYGVAGVSECLCGPEAPYAASQPGDCNDSDPTKAPGKPELCDGADDDCDGKVDEEGATGCEQYYADVDGDGAGDPLSVKCLCQGLSPWVAMSKDDCNDGDPQVGPSAPEKCNGKDDDCDGVIDEQDAQGCTTYLRDLDGDKYGTAVATQCLCAPKAPFDQTVGGDCDDSNSAVHPFATETCNGFDDDCDGMVDPAGAKGCKNLLEDKDEDGFGITGSGLCLCAGEPPYTATSGGDCNDQDPAVAPGVPEVCNFVDDDCDGAIDEQGAKGCTVFYADTDKDGYGNALDARCLCVGEEPYTSAAGFDCDDKDPAVGPGGDEECNGLDDDCDGLTDEPGAVGCKDYLKDADADGFGLDGDVQCGCKKAAPYTGDKGGDCNDGNNTIFPGAVEMCNLLDDNCDGEVDEPGAGGCTLKLRDEDGDGYGVTDDGQCLCGPVPPYSASKAGDCDDAAPSVNPAVTESCNGIDDDCDGLVDETGAQGCSTFYKDADGDTYGTGGTGVCLCGPQGINTATIAGDCDDGAGAVHPNAAEVCNGTDDDCDGFVDPQGSGGCIVYIRDSDGDTFGLTGDQKCLCATSGVYTATKGGDCDDTNSFANPLATELCNNVDDDCDGQVDEAGATGCIDFYKDGDGDGVGDASASACLCKKSGVYVTPLAGDCDDTNAAVHPGAKESCNGKDDSCDGVVDPEGSTGCTLYYKDADVDGFGQLGAQKCLCAMSTPDVATVAGDCNDASAAVSPSATEACNGVDDDCDNQTDEQDATGCTPLFKDADEDGYGVTGDTSCLCAPAGDYTALAGGDCDDADPVVGPGGAEICNGLDDDCDGQLDEENAGGCTPFYKDGDKDGYGVSADSRCLCGAKDLYTTPNGGDCDDTDPGLNPSVLQGCANGGDCCEAGWTCAYQKCIASPTDCISDKDCINDTYCDAGKCIPYGVGPKTKDPACVRPPKVGVFLPAKQCEWTGPPAGDPYPNHRQVLGTPMVADFDLDGDPTTVHPVIVFVSYFGTDGGFPAASSNGIIRILDGKSCQQLYNLDASEVVGAAPPAIGDIDLAADNRPEIVAFAEGGGMVAFKYNASQNKFGLLWHSTNSNGIQSTLGSTLNRWNGPTIVDITGDAYPEILMNAVVHDHSGKVIASNVTGALVGGTGNFDVVVDVDLDGQPELVTGDAIYKYSGNASSGSWVKETYYNATTNPPAFVAVADFGSYPVAGLPAGIPEIVTVAGGEVRVTKLDGTVIFGPITLPSSSGTAGHGGPPTIGDFDGDGQPEFAAAGYGSYTVFDFDCLGSPPPLGCVSEGVLWTRDSQDKSSNRTGSSIFDFEADGVAEAVYADECYTRVYNGSTGDVLFSQSRTSCTWYENPIVADVDGDFKSEIVVGSNTNCNVGCQALDPMFRGLRCDTADDCPGATPVCSVGYCRCTSDANCGDASNGFACSEPLPNTPGKGNVCRAKHQGSKQGILVYRDQSDAWVNSRPIWNQQMYYVTNVEPNGKIPPFAAAKTNWKEPDLNNFLQNVQGGGDPTLVPDITTDLGLLENCDKTGKLSVPVEVCNRGAAPVDAGVPVAFFAGNPLSGGQILCLQKTTQILFPSECEPVTCTYKPSAAPMDVYILSDFGGPKGENTECIEENNLGVFEGVTCTNL